MTKNRLLLPKIEYTKGNLRFHPRLCYPAGVENFLFQHPLKFSGCAGLLLAGLDDTMKPKKPKYTGRWRIIEMEMWDQDYVDMITPGYFSFAQDGLGYFQFGSVEGQIDYRLEKINDLERLEFSWEGQSELDPASGRGWAMLNGDQLKGRFYFHLGDDSWFKAKRHK